MSTLSILHGFLGAGKTTFARRLAVTTGAQRLNIDETLARRHPHGITPADWPALYAATQAELWGTAAELLAQDRDVILDTGFWTYAERTEARSTARACNATLVHYYFDTPVAVLRRRIAQRSGAIAQGNATDFDRLLAGFTAPLPDEDFIRITPEYRP